MVQRKLRKIIGKRSCDDIFGELPRAGRAGITNFSTANMVFCAAFNWSNSSKSGLSFFSFPLKDKKRCKEWLRVMKRKDLMPTAASRLCSSHFSCECFEHNLALRASLGVQFKPQKLRLNAIPDAIPTIFNFEMNTVEQGSIEDSSRKQRKRSSNTKCRRAAFEKRRKLEVLKVAVLKLVKLLSHRGRALLYNF